MTFINVIKKVVAEIIDDDRGPRNRTAVTIHKTNPAPSADGVTAVRPDNTPLIERRGWTCKRNVWQGHYVTKFGTFRGRIEKRGDVFYPYIKHPPKQLEDHHKFPCFHRLSGGWWWVHLHDNPADGDPNAVLQYMERLLHQAISQQ